ncbi:MAG: N-methylhydantoinase A [uncultured Nocardioidaceae bacterium]|uniref:N-methylhydantoinase A n=1 Tax=uncultured Nocardioidaceae bacterium TaxID=253824 RepID=A0A6J4LT08_9ACTN|nr:MAG: N-methylhydantoinase A [uncultured Nocardioidaceae bacterium]
MASTRWTVSIDVGGTYTDATAKSSSGATAVAKVPSTPEDPARGLAAAIAELVAQGVDARGITLVAHGTTIATNAMLTGQLARVALVTTEGFRDVLGYRAGSRPDVYSLHPARPDALVDRELRLEVAERISSRGEVLTPLGQDEVDRVVARLQELGPASIAVSLLFSYVDARHEEQLGRALRAAFPRLPVTLSSEVAREFREYPRTVTTVINAALRPVVGAYLSRAGDEVVRRTGASFVVMQSNGGCVTAERGEAASHRLVLSGPAGGAAGLVRVAAQHGLDKVISLDMGGTSTDVCLVRDGQLPVVASQEFADHKLLAPAVDIHTVGAGGGSIAWVDRTGRLRVGPQSARAVPGPACYGRGGTDATVTDAHAVLGTLGSSALAGGLELDRDAARAAVGRLGEQLGRGVEETAEAVLALAVAHLVRALRRVSVERGLDPRDFTLVPFGGAGPLHAGLLLRQLGLRSVLVPRRAGLFSAEGMLSAGLRIDDSQTVLESVATADAAVLADWFDERSRALREQLERDGVPPADIRTDMAADCRYVGQGFEIPVRIEAWNDSTVDQLTEAFHREHARLYGHANESEPVELVTLRVSARGAFPDAVESRQPRGDGVPAPTALLGRSQVRIPGSGGTASVEVWDRTALEVGDLLHGPCIVSQMDSTTVVLEGQEALVHDSGDLVLTDTRGAAAPALAAAQQATDPRGEPVVDAVSYEVIASALASIAEEMGSVIKRSSYSPIIRDMDDFSCAVFNASGDLVAQADYIPAQLGAMSLVVGSVLERWQGQVHEGDAFLCNHPYMGAMHLPDINVVVPVFVDGELVAWTGTAAHHIDVGGVNPASEGPELGELFAEGLVIPPVRLMTGGQENADVVALVTANIRDPLSTVSDLRAQRAACSLGKDRLLELVQHSGRRAVLSVMERTLDDVEKAVRVALSDLADGTAHASGHLDDDGRGGEPTAIEVVVTKEGDALRIDLSGSASQVAGAMNVPWSSTRAAIVYAVRAVVAPDLAANDGVLRVLDVICPRGNVLNPDPPAAVSARHNTCQRLADTLVRAMSALWPERAVASSTVSFFCFNVGSRSPVDGRPAVMADVVGGGTGATSEGDGLDGVDTYMSNVGLMSAEVAETNYLVRVLRTELLPGSQGAGQFNGGLGLRREYQVLATPQKVTYYCEQTSEEFAPSGAARGGPGRPTRVEVTGPDGELLGVAGKASVTLQPGSVVRVETAGGGGYGDPAHRSPELAARDVGDGRLRSRAATPASEARAARRSAGESPGR